MSYTFIERPMKEEEYTQLLRGFEEHAQEFNNPGEKAQRMGFVALKDGEFIGASSGLAYHSVQGYAPYFYISDLYVEKAYRRQGLGQQLLVALESKLKPLGIRYIWTWTAGYEGKDFYLQQGYTIFAELENWYLSKHSRFGLRKPLESIKG
jgi:GNAT superfamily N-acetyltransferase